MNTGPDVEVEFELPPCPMTPDLVAAIKQISGVALVESA
jgi:hypothetical protein